MKIITELWNGEIAPVEHCGSHDADINKLLALRERNSNNLIEGLEDSQKEILQKYIDCSDEYFFRMQELAFYEVCTGDQNDGRGIDILNDQYM